jgi:hypothetical protein
VAKRELETAIRLVSAENAGELVLPPAAAGPAAAIAPAIVPGVVVEPGPAPARDGPREF